MVIRGNIRGNGEQLAHYLLSGETNEDVQILDVDGRLNATEQYLYQTMQGMSLTAELTKSQKGLYHAQINPAYSEDRKMRTRDWLRAADILAQELGLDEQRRVIVLHTKKNRTHAHVVFERYDHQTGKVVNNKFSRLAQDRARKEMERVFEHQPTPHRNKHRPELKETLTKLWNQTETGKEFVQAVHENGYMLAEGVPRHPLMVVDENGRSFDLVRQLKGTRIKEVRQRMRNEELIPEKEAIELMRQKQDNGSDSSKAQQQKDTDREKAVHTASLFLNNKQDATSKGEAGQDVTEEVDQHNSPEKKKILARDYFRNADELTSRPEEFVEYEETLNLVDRHTKQEEGIIINTSRSEEGQEKADKQFVADSAEKKQSSENEQHRKTLSDFIRSEEGMFAKGNTAGEEARHRQQATARQFFENEEVIVPELTTDEEEIQKLMQEQKETRERIRQKTKRRSR